MPPSSQHNTCRVGHHDVLSLRRRSSDSEFWANVLCESEGGITPQTNDKLAVDKTQTNMRQHKIGNEARARAQTSRMALLTSFWQLYTEKHYISKHNLKMFHQNKPTDPEIPVNDRCAGQKARNMSVRTHVLNRSGFDFRDSQPQSTHLCTYRVVYRYGCCYARHHVRRYDVQQQHRARCSTRRESGWF